MEKLMNNFKVTIVLLVTLLLFACNKNNVKQADPNYMQQINAANQSQMAKAQMVSSLAEACKVNVDDASWCAALVTQTIAGGNGMANAPVPKYTPKPTKGDIILSKSLDLLGKALPVYGNVVISKDNNETNARIAESNNQMMTDIITSGFNGMTTLGSQENIAVGGDYIIGDGNGDGDRYGDGNIVGDGNVSTGDGSIVGDSNIVGDENVTGDANLFADGDSNVIGDDNTNTNGSDNAIDNEVGNDLFNSGGENGDDDDNSVDNNEGDGGGV